MPIPPSENGAGREPPPAEQRARIKELNRSTPMRTGESWYILDKKWFDAWSTYVGFELSTAGADAPRREEPRPGPIDNSHLLTEGGQLVKHTVVEGIDFELVCEPSWQHLLQWYGGGPAIARPVVEKGLLKQRQVEVHPLRLRILFNARPGEECIVTSSAMTKLSEFKTKVCQKLHAEPSKCRLYNYFSQVKAEELADPDTTLEDFRIMMNQSILVEQEGIDGQALTTGVISFPRKQFTYESSASGARRAALPPSDYETSSRASGGAEAAGAGAAAALASMHQPSSFSSGLESKAMRTVDERRHGRCGLSNLGNTCFMNSGLQCLSHTMPLVQYFLQERHLTEMNKANPLGMKGQMAEVYGSLVRELWSSSNTVVPREFKWVISRFAPQFSGYAQHDSQELLAFLLDGLHEDLNRVQQKPYVESIESDGRPDALVATEAWKRHLMRNNSVIVDHFQGQFKSTLICPTCRHVSITFDPFMYLSIPLPEKVDKNITLLFLSAAGKRQIVTVTLPKTSYISALRRKLAETVNANVDAIIFADVWNGKIFRMLGDDRHVDDIMSTDRIVAYEIPLIEGPALQQLCIPVYQFSDPDDIHRKAGYPVFVVVDRLRTTYEQLHRAVWQMVAELLEQDGKPVSFTDDQITRAFSVKYLENYSYNMLDPPRWSPIVDDGNAVVFRPPAARVYLACVWNNRVYRDLYNEEKAAPSGKLGSALALSDYSQRKSKPEMKLSECVEIFTHPEKLSKDDPWYCPKCKDFREASKQLELWRLPQIMIIQLKRFSYSARYREKIETYVDFPLENLDLTKYNLSRDGPAVYDLYAVSNHFGGLGGGHYTAYAKVGTDWFDFDDSSVTRVSQANQVKSASAYVLFYIRREMPATPGIPADPAEAALVTTADGTKHDVSKEKEKEKDARGGGGDSMEVETGALQSPSSFTTASSASPAPSPAPAQPATAAARSSTTISPMETSPTVSATGSLKAMELEKPK